MPAKEKLMSEAESLELLQRAELGRLGLAGKDYPYVVPLNFCLLKGKIYFHGAFQGKKMEIITKESRVCFEVDEGHLIQPKKPGDCSYSYRSVIVYGEARPLEKHEKELFMEAALGLFEKYVISHVPEIKEELIEKTQMVEITIHELTGKKSKDLC